ncbi:PI4-kinase alpha [Intoshia linei]|uniref:1-phosphatidylinositol 4-kinase n=1 Tax=Intoshia linei TaxID=1819745 RepID=A0A177B827_9BILA|nr:PI4-kinase alpha [Intoshia linei]
MSFIFETCSPFKRSLKKYAETRITCYKDEKNQEKSIQILKETFENLYKFCPKLDSQYDCFNLDACIILISTLKKIYQNNEKNEKFIENYTSKMVKILSKICSANWIEGTKNYTSFVHVNLPISYTFSFQLNVCLSNLSNNHLDEFTRNQVEIFSYFVDQLNNKEIDKFPSFFGILMSSFYYNLMPQFDNLTIKDYKTIYNFCFINPEDINSTNDQTTFTETTKLNIESILSCLLKLDFDTLSSLSKCIYFQKNLTFSYYIQLQYLQSICRFLHNYSTDNIELMESIYVKFSNLFDKYYIIFQNFNKPSKNNLLYPIQSAIFAKIIQIIGHVIDGDVDEFISNIIDIIQTNYDLRQLTYAIPTIVSSIKSLYTIACRFPPRAVFILTKFKNMLIEKPISILIKTTKYVSSIYKDQLSEEFGKQYEKYISNLYFDDYLKDFSHYLKDFCYEYAFFAIRNTTMNCLLKILVNEHLIKVTFRSVSISSFVTFVSIYHNSASTENVNINKDGSLAFSNTILLLGLYAGSNKSESTLKIITDALTTILVSFSFSKMDPNAILFELSRISTLKTQETTGILKIYMLLMVRIISSQTNDNYENMGTNKIFSTVAECIVNYCVKKQDMNFPDFEKLLIHLFESFNKLCVSYSKSCPTDILKWDKEMNDFFQNSPYTPMINTTIMLLSRVLSIIKVEIDKSSKIYSMFTGFWSTCCLLGIWKSAWYNRDGKESNMKMGLKKYLQIIAKFSPPCEPRENIQSQLLYSPVSTIVEGETKDLTCIRLELTSLIFNTTYPPANINKLSFRLCIYILTIYRVEVMRINICSDMTSIERLFSYIENSFLRLHKSGILSTITSVVEKIFQVFINIMACKTQNYCTIETLENTCIFLLVNFIHYHKYISRLADSFIANIFERFPFLFWNKNVLSAILDIFNLLSVSTNVKTRQDFNIKINCLNYNLPLSDQSVERETAFKQYSMQIKRIIEQSWKWASKIVQYIIIDYMLMNQFSLNTNMYMSIIFECTTNSDSVMNDFIKNQQSRTQYYGEIEGLIEVSGGSDSLLPLLSKKLYISVENKDLNLYTKAVMRIAAYVIKYSQNSRQLLKEMCFSVANFPSSEPAIVLADALNWILAIKRNLTHNILFTVVSCWVHMMDRKLGIYAPVLDKCETIIHKDPKIQADIEKNLLFEETQSKLLDFINQCMSLAKYDDWQIIRIFIRFFNITLSYYVGPHIRGHLNLMSRSIRLAGTRFKILHMAMLFLHDEIIVDPCIKCLLRQRVYATAFDYFSIYHKSFIYNEMRLNEHVNDMAIFWKFIHSDKKYVSSLSDVLLNINSEYGIMKDYLSGDSRNVFSTLPMESFKSISHFKNGTFGSRSIKSLNSSRRIYRRYGIKSKNYIYKRQLLLSFLTNEIERFLIRNNPSKFISKIGEIKHGAEISERKNRTFNENQWKDFTQICWNMSPHVAIALNQRFPVQEIVFNKLGNLINKDKCIINDNVNAISFYTNDNLLKNNSFLATRLLDFRKISGLKALSFFSRMYVHNFVSAQFAFNILSNISHQTVLDVLPQIIQSLRYERFGFVKKLLGIYFKTSPILSHFFLWNMKSNMYFDEDQKNYDNVLGPILEEIIEFQISIMSPDDKNFFQREFDFFDKLTNVSKIIRPFLKENRKAKCIEAVKEIELPLGVYLPSSPNCIVVKIKPETCSPMQSAIRAPYLLEFEVHETDFQIVENYGTNVLDANDVEKMKLPIVKSSCIFKYGDDCRQDILTLQILKIFKDVINEIGLDIYVYPYNVIATNTGSAIIECVKNCQSRGQIGQKNDYTLLDHFICKYGEQSTPSFKLVIY